MFIPGFPFAPFCSLSILTSLAAWKLPKWKESMMASIKSDKMNKPKTGDKKSETEVPMEQLLKLDAIQVELGYALVHLADQSKKGDLLSRVTGIRKNFARDMGVVIPPIKVKDNLQLQGPEYRLILKGEEHARGEIHADRWLAMNASDSKEVLDGIQTTEPVYQLPATWISNIEKKKAELKGFTVVDATTVLVTHLSETIKQQAAEILTRQDVQHLLDNLKETHATVINELIPAQLSIGQVHRVLQNLLAEGLSIRNLSEFWSASVMSLRTLRIQMSCRARSPGIDQNHLQALHQR